MNDNLTKVDVREIYGYVFDVLVQHNIDEDQTLEEKIAMEYGDFAQYWVYPWVAECIERGMTAQKVIDITFPGNAHTVDQEQIVRVADGFRETTTFEEDEEVMVVEPPVKVVAPAPVVEVPKVKVERKPRQTSSGSLSGQAWPLYQNMYNINSDVRNTDAQRAIAGELNIVDPKQLNSLRAMVVKFKKKMKES